MKRETKLVIYDLDKMTKGQRGFVYRWLLRQAKFIKPMHRQFASRYVASIVRGIK